MWGLWVSEIERIWRRKRMIAFGGVYLLLLLSNMWMLKLSGWGQYRFGGRVEMHELSAPWFMMEGISLLLVMAILPILFVEHLGGEIHSGAYRMYMLRSFSRFRLWLAKLLALIATIGVFMGTTCLIAFACGRLFFPHSDTVLIYGAEVPIASTAAALYTVKVYLLLALVCVLKLALSSMVCLFVPRPLMAYIVIFVGSIAALYLNKELVLLFDPFQRILTALSPEGWPKFWIYAIGFTAVFAAASFWRWERRAV